MADLRDQQRQQQLSDEVIAIVAKTAKRPPETIAPETTFEELGLDSLDGVEIAYELEERFGVTIPNEAFKGVRGVQDVIAALRPHLPATPAPDA